MNDQLLPQAEADESEVIVVEPTRELLAFMVAAEAYAFDLSNVREILRLKPITPVPRTSLSVLGVITVRGQVTTVFDLRHVLRLEPEDATRHARILLITLGEEVVGVLVDRVLQVFRLESDEVELTSGASGESSDHIIGIGRPRERTRSRDSSADFLVLIDPEALIRRFIA
ncbi:MAG: purine-binding chemotaxis protein CheW [Polyangiales bacterium]|jgi:purine-binding chemotaxis protein CheW